MQKAEWAIEKSHKTACSVPPDTQLFFHVGQIRPFHSAGDTGQVNPAPMAALLVQLFGKLQKQWSSLPSWLLLLKKLLDMQELVVDPLSQGRDMIARVQDIGAPALHFPLPGEIGVWRKGHCTSLSAKLHRHSAEGQHCPHGQDNEV